MRLLFTVFLFLAFEASADELVSGKLNLVGNATHLEFKGTATWNYQLQQVAGKKGPEVHLLLPKVEESTLEKLKNWKGQLIRKINVERAAVDGKVKLVFELASSKIQAFDYLTDEPSRLIVDFFRSESEKEDKPAPKKTALVVEGKRTEKAKEKKKEVAEEKVVSHKLKIKRRTPAGTEFMTKAFSENEIQTEVIKLGLYDGGDPSGSRFKIKDSEIKESSILDSRENIYLKFPILKLDPIRLQELWAKPPIYEITAEKNEEADPKLLEENKLARLLLKFYKDEKYAIFSKTLKHFRTEFPDSKYDEMLGYMEADFDYKKWRKDGELAAFERAMSNYRLTIEKYPNSPLFERTMLLMGYSYLYRKDAFSTLQTFQRLMRLRPQTKYRSQMDLAMAEAYLSLNKYKDALRQYRKVASTPQQPEHGIEADYLTGDVFFSKKDYVKANDEYQKALRAHPDEWRQYPNAYFNRAESLFWLGRHKEALEAYGNFMQRFPTHSFGGYAMTRVGELLEVLGAPKKRSMGAFKESYFRYPASEGAKVARVQILTGRMKDMKERELKDSLKTLREIAKNSKLAKIEEYVQIKIADGLYDRGEHKESTERLEKFYQQNPTSVNLRVLRSRIVRNIATDIEEATLNKNFFKALREYNKYKDSWLKKSKRLDVDFHVGLAFEQAGVYDEADKTYRKTLNRVYSLGKEALKSSSFEKYPKKDVLNLRLAATVSQKGEYSKANDYLKRIKNASELDARQQVELVEIAARVAEARGNMQMAKNFLTQLTNTWSGEPELVVSPYIKLAQLQTKTKSYSRARGTLEKVLNLVNDSGLVSKEDHFAALKLKGDIEVKTQKKARAVVTYEEILKTFSDRNDLDPIRYKTGELLLDMGKVKEAERTWRPLQEKGSGMWAKLAQEKMKHIDWKRDYKKYIERIPAMEGFEGGKIQ